MHRISKEDNHFPETLEACSVETLYLRGALPSSARPHLAVVGTRRSTPEGERITRALIEPLARAGVVVVSGLAEGIDTAAHRAALDANGATIAVLGTGVDDESIYPQRNVRLAREIIERGGAVLSEYPTGTPGRKYHFPQRNRIIAALSRVTLVVEAPERSGALITANHAQDFNKVVAAVPGALHSPQAKGCNALLEAGAEAVATSEHLGDLLGVSLNEAQDCYVPQSSNERELLSLLEAGPQGVDSVLDRCTIPTSQALSTLSDLEQKNIIEEIDGKRYALRTTLG